LWRSEVVLTTLTFLAGNWVSDDPYAVHCAPPFTASLADSPGISSDDIFWYFKPPGKTYVVIFRDALLLRASV